MFQLITKLDKKKVVYWCLFNILCYTGGYKALNKAFLKVLNKDDEKKSNTY